MEVVAQSKKQFKAKIVSINWLPGMKKLAVSHFDTEWDRNPLNGKVHTVKCHLHLLLIKMNQKKISINKDSHASTFRNMLLFVSFLFFKRELTCGKCGFDPKPAIY